MLISTDYMYLVFVMVLLKSVFNFQSYHKVTVLGASSDIGQPLSLLLKQNPNISQLALFDSFGIYGVATDLSHVNSSAKVAGKICFIFNLISAYIKLRM